MYAAGPEGRSFTFYLARVFSAGFSIIQQQSTSNKQTLTINLKPICIRNPVLNNNVHACFAGDDED